jgi:hypothetical protein
MIGDDSKFCLIFGNAPSSPMQVSASPRELSGGGVHSCGLAKHGSTLD